MQPSKKDTKISSADDLAKTSKHGDIELDDKELEQVSGGKKNVANDFENLVPDLTGIPLDEVLVDVDMLERH